MDRLVNRTLDVLLAVAGLFLLLPVMGLIMLAIKLESPGPILARQQRVGERGRILVLNTFRCESGRNPVVTRVGRLLRATRLDELPTLWNLLVGDITVFKDAPRSIRL